jgi:hypothetical protein
MRTTTICLLLLALALPAQAQVWSVDVYAGGATFSDVPTAAGSANAVFGLRRSGVTRLYLDLAAPLSASDPMWGAAGFDRRVSTQAGLLTLGVDIAGHGHAFRTGDTARLGTGGTVSVMPMLGIGTHTARLELRSGLRQYGAAYAGLSYSRSLHESAARLAVQPDVAFQLEGEVRQARADEDTYAYVGAAASARLGRVDVWGSAGRWLHDYLPDAGWSVGALLDVGRRFDVWVGLQNDATDPLFWNETRRGWNLGVGRSFGATAAQQPVSVTAPTRGGIAFAVPLAEAASAPYVAGDFNGWQPVRLERVGNTWSTTLFIRPGTYHYAFRRADGTWFLPASVPARVADGFGGVSALLIVE